MSEGDSRGISGGTHVSEENQGEISRETHAEKRQVSPRVDWTSVSIRIEGARLSLRLGRACLEMVTSPDFSNVEYAKESLNCIYLTARFLFLLSSVSSVCFLH